MTTVPLSPNDPAWNDYISRVPHDFYHRAEYHLFEEMNGQGSPFLFVACQGDEVFAWPYLLKSVRIPGVAVEFETTEVHACYGYPGPSCSPGASQDFLANCIRDLIETWKKQKAVTVFSRFHPVLQTELPFRRLEQAGVLRDYQAQGSSVLTMRGQTVSMDVSQPTAARQSGYQASVRRHVRKNTEAGAVTMRDEQFQHLPTFCEFYRATMVRTGAEPSYLFNFDYFDRLRRLHPGIIHLFVTTQGSDILCAALISEYQRRMQAVFIMSNPALMANSPAKKLVDDVSEWGRIHGAVDFHLGGGKGARRDSLFEFKAGFSSLLRDFHTLGMIVDHQEYMRLVEIRRSVGPLELESNFFPAWRTPLPESQALTTEPVTATARC